MILKFTFNFDILIFAKLQITYSKDDISWSKIAKKNI